MQAQDKTQCYQTAKRRENNIEWITVRNPKFVIIIFILLFDFSFIYGSRVKSNIRASTAQIVGI